MFARKTVLLFSAGGFALAGPAVGQTPPPPTPIASAAPVAAPAFPPGSEVLSLQGEPLGVLARVETRPGGERILHIRGADGSMTTAPAVVAFRGERAIVLDWARAGIDTGVAGAVTDAAATPADAAGSVPPRT